MLLQSWCNWKPQAVDSAITAIHSTASLTRKPNNAYNFIGMQSPSLVVNFQKAINGGRQMLLKIFSNFPCNLVLDF